MLFHSRSSLQMQRLLVICSPAFHCCDFGQVPPFFYPLRSAQIVVSILYPGLIQLLSYGVIFCCVNNCSSCPLFLSVGLGIPTSEMKIIVLKVIFVDFVDLGVHLKKYLINTRKIYATKHKKHREKRVGS